jgi:hypothetical protein
VVVSEHSCPSDHPPAEEPAVPPSQVRESGTRRSRSPNVFDPAFAKIAALLLALLFLAKIYGAARFSLTTATALAAAASPVSVLLGTLALYEYAFMALVSSVCGWVFIAGIRHADELRRWWPLTFPLAVFTCLLTPLYYLMWAGIAIAAALGIGLLLRFAVPWLSHRLKKSRTPPTISTVAVFTAMLAVMTFVFGTIQRPWLPAEVITLDKPITVDPATHETAARPVAYIIAESSGWTTLLIDSDRYLAMVKTADIQRRRICHLSGQLGSGQPFFDWIINQPYTSPNLSCSLLTDQPTKG